MGNGHNNDDDDDRKDLTRIEDLSEFLHEDDPDLESKFGDFDQSYHKADGTSTEVTTGGLDLPDVSDLSDLESENATGEAPPEVSFESSENDSEELISMPDVPFDLTDESSGETSFDTSLPDSSDDLSNDSLEGSQEDSFENSLESSDDFSFAESSLETPSEDEAVSEPFTTDNLPSYENSG